MDRTGRSAAPPICFANCVVNQVLALRNRVLMAVPAMTDKGYAMLKHAASKVKRALDLPARVLVPMERVAFLSKYQGGKRRAYEQAFVDLDERGYQKRWSQVKSFVKAEKHLDATKDPRIIQARPTQYQCMVGPYMAALEHYLYAIPARRLLRRGFGRFFAKGRTPLQRGKDIAGKFRHMSTRGSVTVVSIDQSRFDAHAQAKHLKCEHAVYKAAFPGDPELRARLRDQLHTKGTTSDGVRYSLPGCRCSGDPNTACGNCILMAEMLCAFDEKYPEFGFDVYDDGDDALVFILTKDLAKFRTLIPGFFLEFGMECKVENVGRFIEHAHFCQARPVLTSAGYMLCPDPAKVLRMAYSGVKEMNDPGIRVRYLATLNDFYLAQHGGLPVLSAYHKFIARGLPSNVTRLDESVMGWWAGTCDREVDWNTTASTRASFTLAWEYSEEEQLALEGLLDARSGPTPHPGVHLVPT